MAALASTVVVSKNSSRPRPAPLLAQIDDLLKEAREDVNAEAPADTGDAGVVRPSLEGVA